MRALSAADILRVWERGSTRHPIDRALAIVAAAGPDADGLAPADLPLGERNRRLLALRESTFGATLAAHAACVECGEQVELRVRADAVAGAPDARPAEPGGAPLNLRKLTSRDLAAAARCGSAAEARRLLASRAICREDDDEPLPEADVSRIAPRLHDLDPLAAITLGVRCPACAATWECELDVGGFLWIEIEAEALRLLREVHILASAYGWHEEAILAMSPLRRRAYLELVP